jgi:ATP-binding cassette subfamily B protein
MPAAAVTVVRTRGVPRRFPFLQQIDGLDCGPTCLEMIGRYYGRNYSRQYIRQLCQLDRQGASFATLGRAAERLGFRTLGVRLSFEDLRDKALLPCIAFWGSAHFVVIYRISGDRVSVADPSAGLLTWTREEFESSWLAETGGNGSGFVLLLERTGELVPDTMPEDQRPTSRYLWEPLRMDLRPRLLPIASAAILSLVIQFAAPFLAATLVDSGVSRGDLSFIHVVLIAQFVFFLSKLGIDTLQASLVAYIGLRLDIRLTAAFIAKLTRLPLSFFDSKRIGDLFQRIADHQRIQQFLTDGLSTLLLALLSLAVFGAVLAVFRPMLFFIFAAGSGLYLAYWYKAEVARR